MKKKTKSFVYFEVEEGGMEVHEDIRVSSDMSFLHGWMNKRCKDEDIALIESLLTLKVGEMFDHRLGNLIRLRNVKGD